MARTIVPVLHIDASAPGLWPSAAQPLPPALQRLSPIETGFQRALTALTDASAGFSGLIVVAPADAAGAVLDQIEAIDARPTRLVFAPKDAGPQAVAALAAFAVDEVDPAALALLVPADITLVDPAAFAAGVRAAETDTAVVCFEQGGYVFRPGVLLDAFGDDRAGVRDCASIAWFGARREGIAVRLAPDAFERAPGAESLEAVLQRPGVRVTASAAGLGASVAGWADVWREAPKDADGNVVLGAAHVLGCSNALVRSDVLPVMVAGLDDVFVIATETGLLVTSRAFAEQAMRAAPGLARRAP